MESHNLFLNALCLRNQKFYQEAAESQPTKE